MNFGIDIASQQLRGVQVDLLKINHDHEPENAESALRIYASLLLPERDVEPTIKRLLPLLNDPSLQQKLLNPPAKSSDKLNMIDAEDLIDKTKQSSMSDKNKLAQVVGIIIGSPEFQRR